MVKKVINYSAKIEENGEISWVIFYGNFFNFYLEKFPADYQWVK